MQPIQQSPKHAAPSIVPVAIYTRVSTLHQVGGRFDSCESQAAICRDYIRKRAHEGWTEFSCHTDAAYSGGSMNRPGLQALMRQIEAGEVKVVLIFKFERMLRNTDEWAPFRSFLARHGCRLVSTTEDLSEETPSGRLKNNMLVSVAEYERLTTAEKVRAKLAELAKRGIWNCGLVPFGYDYDAAAKLLSPNSQEAAIVKRIYAEAARLRSLTDIANRLTEEGIRTRQRIFKRRDGRRVTVGGKAIKSDWLRHLIKNPIYSGRVRLKGHAYSGQHEAIVSAETWEQANAAVANALRPARCRVQARDKNCHLLKGLVVCAHCGRAMIPNASGKRDAAGKLYRYYTYGQAHQEGSPCPVRHVSADLLELTTVRFIGALLRHPEIVTETLEVANGRRRGDRKQAGTRVKEIDHALGEIDAALQRIVDVIAAPDADVLGEELRARAGTLKARKQALLVEREQLRQDLLTRNQPKLDAARLLAAIARFAEIFPTLSQTEQKDLVALCVARIELRSDPSRDDRPGRRRFRVRFKLHLERLAEGMEEQVVVDRSSGPGSSPATAPLTLESRLIFQSMGRAPKAILVAPFNEEFLDSRPTAKIEPAPAIATGKHPVLRALGWARRLRGDASLTQAALARLEGVTAVTLTYHLKLLKLAPEIQAFLKGLSEPADLRRYSLRRMKSLAELSVTAQRDQFSKMRADDGAPAQLPAKSVRSR